MPVILLRTVIHAPVERVFDLSRSIEFHQDSTDGTQERAVEGRTTGLIELGEHVTWEARHLGLRQHLTAKITKLDRPHHFQDVMLRGAFKHMVHDHTFEQEQARPAPPAHLAQTADIAHTAHIEAPVIARTIMSDRFEFSAPLGPLGKLAERLFLTNYMRGFLERRNAHLKRVAESADGWQRYL